MRLFSHRGIFVLLLVAAATPVVCAGALADELLVMPYSCRVAGGRPVLTPSEDQGHPVIGRRERQEFRACSPVNPGLCRRWNVHRFDLDCGGVRVPWVEVAAAAEGARNNGRAYVSGGRLELEMPARWSLPPDAPCAGMEASEGSWNDGGFRRFCAERLAGVRPITVAMPRGFAPMLGIDGIFVADKSRRAAMADAPPPYGDEEAEPVMRPQRGMLGAEPHEPEFEPGHGGEPPPPEAYAAEPPREPPAKTFTPKADPPAKAAAQPPAPKPVKVERAPAADPPPKAAASSSTHEPAKPERTAANDAPPKAEALPSVPKGDKGDAAPDPAAKAPAAPSPQEPAKPQVAANEGSAAKAGPIIPTIINGGGAPQAKAPLETGATAAGPSPAPTPAPSSPPAGDAPQTVAQSPPPPDPVPAAGQPSLPGDPGTSTAIPVELVGGPADDETVAIAAGALAALFLLTVAAVLWRKRTRSTSAFSRDIAAVSFDRSVPQDEQVPTLSALPVVTTPSAARHDLEPSLSTPPAPWGDAIPRTREEAMRVLGMGIAPDVNEAAIKKIIDGLRLSWHPDHASSPADRATRELRLKQINVAWDIITGQRRNGPPVPGAESPLTP